jgi:hypothetical protein
MFPCPVVIRGCVLAHNSGSGHGNNHDLPGHNHLSDILMFIITGVDEFWLHMARVSLAFRVCFSRCRKFAWGDGGGHKLDLKTPRFYLPLRTWLSTCIKVRLAW